MSDSPPPAFVLPRRLSGIIVCLVLRAKQFRVCDVCVCVVCCLCVCLLSNEMLFVCVCAFKRNSESNLIHCIHHTCRHTVYRQVVLLQAAEFWFAASFLYLWWHGLVWVGVAVGRGRHSAPVCSKLPMQSGVSVTDETPPAMVLPYRLSCAIVCLVLFV